MVVDSARSVGLFIQKNTPKTLQKFSRAFQNALAVSDPSHEVWRSLPVLPQHAMRAEGCAALSHTPISSALQPLQLVAWNMYQPLIIY